MIQDAIVLKLSGEALGRTRPLSGDVFEAVASQVGELVRSGFRVGVVVGGGNIFRGSQPWAGRDLPRRAKDELGMHATYVNARALMFELELELGVNAKLIADPAAPCAALCDPWDEWAFRGGDEVIIVAGGIGRSGVSTDVAAPYLARDMHAGRIIMSKHGVDGLYPEDPNRAGLVDRPTLIPTTTMSRVLRDQLKVMDRAAMQLCQLFGLTVQIVAADSPQSIVDAARGEPIGTIIYPDATSRAPAAGIDVDLWVRHRASEVLDELEFQAS